MSRVDDEHSLHSTKLDSKYIWQLQWTIGVNDMWLIV